MSSLSRKMSQEKKWAVGDQEVMESNTFMFGDDLPSEYRICATIDNREHSSKQTTSSH